MFVHRFFGVFGESFLVAPGRAVLILLVGGFGKVGVVRQGN
jgi:hypothetical protein